MQATTKIRGTTGRRRNMVPLHILLILGAFTMIFPFYWMIVTSFKTLGESIMVPPTMWPNSWAPANYQEVLRTLPMWQLYFNTMLLIALRIVCAVVFSSMAAFAFAKLRFPFKGLLFFIVITQQMLPPQVYIIPQYLQLSKINMLNTHFALLYPGLVSAFGTFFLRQFYLSLPPDLSEAAMIDGCNPIQIFFKVVFPILKPTMISTAILETMWVWNDYLLPTLVLDIKKYRTIPMAIQYFRGGYGRVELAPMMACIIIAIIPIIILYMTCQKYIIEGVVAGAVKG